MSAQRWAYEREVAVGSVLSISRTDVTATPPRFFAPANYQTPFGYPTARLEGHQLAQYQVGNSGARTVTHDDAGRVTSDGTQDFVYDDFGALVVVKEAGGGAEKEVYLHDVTGRLVGVRGPDERGEVLTYDGAQAVQARTWAGAVAWTASWGPGVDHLVSVEKEGVEYFALDDGKGSVVGWLDGVSNQVVGRAEYTPEGLGRFQLRGGGRRAVPPAAGHAFGFHTAYASKTTGLLYFRNRWYSPEANQWLSQDPLDAVDSFNLYAFNGFDSVNFVDPWGLEAQSATTQGLSEVGPGSKTVCAEDWNCWSKRILDGTLQDLRLTKARALAGDLMEVAHDFSAALHGAVFQFAVSMLPLPYPDPTRPAVPDAGDHMLPFHAGRFGGALGAGVVGAFELALAVTGGLAAVKGEVVSVGGIAAIPKTVKAAIALGALGLATMAKGATDAANAVEDYIKEKGNGSPAASPSSGDKPAGSTTPDGAGQKPPTSPDPAPATPETAPGKPPLTGC